MPTVATFCPFFLANTKFFLLTHRKVTLPKGPDGEDKGKILCPLARAHTDVNANTHTQIRARRTLPAKGLAESTTTAEQNDGPQAFRSESSY